MKPNQEVVASFEALLRQLLESTGASRVTLRLDHAGRGFHVDDVVAEARKPDVASLKGQTSIDQRAAATVAWLDRERRLLVQDELARADPAPPSALVQIYGTRAQMLGPIVQGGALVGWISVHENTGPRRWTEDDTFALEAALNGITRQLEHI